MTDIFHRVLDYWRRMEVSLAPPRDAPTLRHTFEQAGLVVAEDFFQFCLITGGMKSNATDYDLWSCWDITKIVEENQSYPKTGVIFADWCIHAHLHLVRPESPVISSVWVDMFNGDEPFKVADSLTAFLDRYLARDSETWILFGNDPIPSDLRE